MPRPPRTDEEEAAARWRAWMMLLGIAVVSPASCQGLRMWTKAHPATLATREEASR